MSRSDRSSTLLLVLFVLLPVLLSVKDDKVVAEARMLQEERVLRHNGNCSAHSLPWQHRDVDAVDGDTRAGADFEEPQDAAQERALATPAAATDADLGTGGDVKAHAA